MAQSYYPSAQNLIDAALETIRTIDPDSSLTPTAIQRSNALIRLNLIVTSWQAHGLQVWCTKTATLTLVSGQASYTLGPSGADLTVARPLSISQAWLHNISSNSDPVPLNIEGREVYNRYTQKATATTPHTVYYDPTYDLPAANSGANATGKLYVYPAPDTTSASTYSLQLVYTRPIQDFAALSDSLDFPQTWYNAIVWNLASQMCPGYGVPVMYWDRIQAMAAKELKTVADWDVEEGSMFIHPAYQQR